MAGAPGSGQEQTQARLWRSGDAAISTLGSHMLVIADHNGAFQPNAQASVNFTQPGAVMKVDSIDRWRSETRWSTNAVLSAFATVIITANDVKAAFISSDKGEVALTYLYSGKTTMNALGGLSFSLSTLSYVYPAMQILAKRLPNYIVG